MGDAFPMLENGVAAAAAYIEAKAATFGVARGQIRLLDPRRPPAVAVCRAHRDRRRHDLRPARSPTQRLSRLPADICPPNGHNPPKISMGPVKQRSKGSLNVQ
jgi:hypothetical protein